MTAVRTKPRHHETVCLRGRTKWRLDALCAVGLRSRSATVEMLVDYYCRHHPKVAAAIRELENEPHPIRILKSAE